MVKNAVNARSVLQSRLTLLLKLVLTLAAFALLLSHKITLDGETNSVFVALRSRLGHLSWQRMAPYLIAAVTVKCVGVGCAIWRWHLLIAGQNISVPYSRTIATFMIGRFFGVFLPGTVGLDGYKALDIVRTTGRLAETIAATAVEKITGLAGIALVFISTAYLGRTILGDKASLILSICIPLALGFVSLVIWGLLRPQHMTRQIQRFSCYAPARLGRQLSQTIQALAAYERQPRRLTAVLALSFIVHWSTASVYVLTAQAVGARHETIGPVVFASCIQILATVLSPFTIAGEGVREVVSALLLARTLGLTDSIVSAALGFWVAEAVPTLVGGILWLFRPVAKTSWITAASQQRAGSRDDLDDSAKS